MRVRPIADRITNATAGHWYLRVRAKTDGITVKTTITAEVPKTTGATLAEALAENKEMQTASIMVSR